MKVGLFFVVLLLACCAFGLGCRNSPVSATELDSSGCIGDPPPPPAGEQGPFPFESCRPKLLEKNPLRVLDEEATAAARKTRRQACCYKVAEP